MSGRSLRSSRFSALNESFSDMMLEHQLNGSSCCEKPRAIGK